MITYVIWKFPYLDIDSGSVSFPYLAIDSGSVSFPYLAMYICISMFR